MQAQCISYNKSECLITISSELVKLLNDNEKYVIEPSPVLAKDTTGAGDMYAAGFLASLAKGNNYESAGKVAVKLAEEVIQIQGAQFDIHVIRRLGKSLNEI